jgi:putative ABC transport system permease protein
MTWLGLSCRNARRRPLRTLVTVAAVAVAVATLFSLLSFQQGYQAGIRAELDRLGAHILVVPKGCPYDAASIALHGASWPCYLKATYLDQVRGATGVATAAPVYMAALYGDGGETAVYLGIDPEYRRLKQGWQVDGSFPRERGDLLVGAAVAQRRGWRLGQRVALPGLPGQRGRVAGVLAPTRGADDEFIHLRLPDAQRLFARPEQITHILVRVADPEELEMTVAQLRSCGAGLDMNVVPVAHLFRTIQSLLAATRLLLGAVVLVGLLIAAAGVSNALLMAVAERAREIGTMRALGASRGDVYRLFWLEGVELALAGAVLGLLLAFLGAGSLEAWLRTRLPFAPSDPLIRWDGITALACVGAAAVLGSLAGALPAWRASLLSPVEAMRSPEAA